MTNKERFIEICTTQIHRDGMNRLLDWLEKSDFYSAPASSRFHLSEEGGLCQHSLNVYDQLLSLCRGQYAEYCTAITDESIAIAALFHDLCKVHFYKTEMRNVKKDGVWTSVPYYTIDERFAFGGHGSKSVFLAERFIRLTTEEAVAINCHMGLNEHERSIGTAYERNPLAWLTHVADEAATFLVETKPCEEKQDD